MCNPVVGFVVSAGLQVAAGAQQAAAAQAQADYDYNVRQAQADHSHDERRMQMDWEYRERLRNSENEFQNSMRQREAQYQNQLAQFEFKEMEATRQFEFQQAQFEMDFMQAQAQVEADRAYEEMQVQQQQAVMEQNEYLAGIAYEDDLRQLDTSMMAEQELAAQQKLKASREAMQQRAAVRATGRVGNSVDNLIADYNRQQAQFDFVTSRNLAFTGMGIQEKKRGAKSTYAARKFSQQPYISRTFTDPQKGIAYKGSGGVAPTYGPMPVRGGVTKGTVLKAPVYKSFVAGHNWMATAANVAGTFNQFGGFKKKGTTGSMWG